MLLFTGVASEVSANTSTSQVPSDAILDEIIDVISEGIEVSQDGIKVKNKRHIIDELKKLDLDAFDELAKLQGMEYNGRMNEARLLNMYIEKFDALNKGIENGDLIVLEHGTMVEPDDDGFYLQANVNRTTTHWWGRNILKSAINASRWAADIRMTAHAGAGTALLSMTFGGPLGVYAGAVTGITSLWAYNLADRIDYHNGRTNRGIQANVHWTTTYRVYPQ